MTRQPRGLHLAALRAAVLGAAAASATVMVDPGPLAPWKVVAMRAAAALLAVLSGVAAEAPLHALALAWVSLLTPLFVWLGGSPASYWMLACGGLVIIPLVLSVRHHTSGALHRGRRVPRPARRS